MYKINWKEPVFPAVCLAIAFICAYHASHTGSLDSWLITIATTFYAWTWWYNTSEKEKALPKKSYLLY
jgi:hypothetical protein